MDADSPITATLINSLENNPTEIAAGTGGAPKIQQAAIEPGAVGQGQLKTGSGTVSVSSGASGYLTLPGGEYGFLTNVKSGYEGVATLHNTVQNTSYTPQIYLTSTGGSVTAAWHRYIQSSPPYDLGDGEVPLFIFADIDNATGKVVRAYEAPEAPWHNNGPTNAKADTYSNGIGYQYRKDSVEINKAMMAAGHPTGMTMAQAKQAGMRVYADYIAAFSEASSYLVEVTQTIKQADMALLPSPTQKEDGLTTVMLDPVADITNQLFQMKQFDDFSVLELLHSGDLVIDNSPINRAGPPGVPVHSYRWR